MDSRFAGCHQAHHALALQPLAGGVLAEVVPLRVIDIAAVAGATAQAA